LINMDHTADGNLLGHLFAPISPIIPLTPMTPIDERGTPQLSINGNDGSNVSNGNYLEFVFDFAVFLISTDAIGGVETC
jgi:hypothetical protein